MCSRQVTDDDDDDDNNTDNNGDTATTLSPGWCVMLCASYSGGTVSSESLSALREVGVFLKEDGQL